MNVVRADLRRGHVQSDEVLHRMLGNAPDALAVFIDIVGWEDLIVDYVLALRIEERIVPNVRRDRIYRSITVTIGVSARATVQSHIHFLPLGTDSPLVEALFVRPVAKRIPPAHDSPPGANVTTIGLQIEAESRLITNKLPEIDHSAGGTSSYSPAGNA
jgi:hypothetical protein